MRWSGPWNPQVTATNTDALRQRTASECMTLAGRVGVPARLRETRRPDRRRSRGIAIAEPQGVGILADPAAYYINVHTETFPAGAIRGQLAGEAATGTIAVPINAGWVLALIILALATFGLISVRARQSRPF